MHSLFLAAVSGVLLTLSFPKVEWYPLVFVALVPLFKSLEGLSLRRAFLVGWMAGLVHFTSLLYWIYHVVSHFGGLGWLLSIVILMLLVSVLALFIALFCLASRWASSHGIGLVLAAPSAWVSLEWLRTHFLTGFPWELLGYSLYTRLTLIQVADIFGVYGVSFMIVSVNLAVYHLIFSKESLRQRFFAKEIITACLVLLAFSIYGHFRLASIEKSSLSAPRVSVGIAQGNIEQDRKWAREFQNSTLDIYEKLTRETAELGAELVVWPETAAPFYYGRDKGLSLRLNRIAASTGVYLLFGSPAMAVDLEGHIRLYNRAYLMSPESRILGYYDKSHLVPYGEYVPFKEWFSFLGKIVAEVGDFASGEKGGVLQYDNVRVGPLICFESIFPYLARTATQKGANLLANMTNDAWFERSSAPYQHFSMLTFRSIENRRFSVRAANTGISGVIHASGRVLQAGPIFVPAHMCASVPLLESRTFYSRFGDVFAFSCIFVIVILIVREAIRKGRADTT